MMEAGKRCALVVGGVLLLAACGHENKPAAVPPVPPPETAPASELAPEPAPAAEPAAPEAAPAPLAPAAGKAGPRCIENFKLFDLNHDGRISKAEFMMREHWRADPEQAFNARDNNGDGVLNEEEFCSVSHGWRPVTLPPP